MEVAQLERWESLAQKGALLDAVVEFVRAMDFVTFVELQRKFAEHIPTRGDHAFCLESDENLILWTGLSNEFIELLSKAMAAKRIFPHPASVLVYAVDGSMLTLPVAKRPPASGYKELHWFPVCFRVLPFELKGRKRRTGLASAMFPTG
jgi:hypothetical protein